MAHEKVAIRSNPPAMQAGTGEVYRARDTRLGGTVAIKSCETNACGDPHRDMQQTTEPPACNNSTSIHDVNDEGTAA